MKANELRVGNWLKLKGHDYVPTIVQSIHDLKGIKTSVDHEFTDIDNFEPILLTQEWLRKLSFREDNKYAFRNRYYIITKHGKNTWYIHHRFSGIDSRKLTRGVVITEVSYVHELQNIYFALKHKELEIK